MSRELEEALSRKGATVASLREVAERVMAEAVSRYGNASASAGVDFFNEVLYADGIGPMGVMPTGIYTRDEISRIAHYQAGKLRKDDRLGFVRRVADSTAGLVYHGGNRAVVWQSGVMGGSTNTSREYGYLLYHSANSTRLSGMYQIRYARVPQGVETCDFCLMLASRGFVYLTAESAAGWNHTHRDCDCIVVPGVGHQAGSKEYTGGGTFDYSDDWGWVQDTTLDGYDLDAMRRLHREWAQITKDDGPGQLSEAARLNKLDAMRRIIGRTVW